MNTIDAETARKLAFEHNLNKEKDRLESIMAQIQNAAANGKYQIALINNAGELTPEIKTYITGQGFKLEYSSEVIQGVPCSYTKISW